MTATLLEKQPAPRAPEMLRKEPDGDERPQDTPWFQRAPGLYPGEQVFEIETGALVAVAVEPIWRANNEGVELYGSARWVDEDGSTHLSPHGAHVEVEYRHPFLLSDLEALGGAAAGLKRVAKEIVKAMLGEGEAEMIDIVDSPPVDPAALPPGARILDASNPPEGTVLNPAATQRPLLPLSDEQRLNINIRHALAMVEATGEEAIDVGKLLA